MDTSSLPTSDPTSSSPAPSDPTDSHTTSNPNGPLLPGIAVPHIEPNPPETFPSLIDFTYFPPRKRGPRSRSRVASRIVASFEEGSIVEGTGTIAPEILVRNLAVPLRKEERKRMPVFRRCDISEREEEEGGGGAVQGPEEEEEEEGEVVVRRKKVVVKDEVEGESEGEGEVSGGEGVVGEQEEEGEVAPAGGPSTSSSLRDIETDRCQFESLSRLRQKEIILDTILSPELKAKLECRDPEEVENPDALASRFGTSVSCVDFRALQSAASASAPESLGVDAGADAGAAEIGGIEGKRTPQWREARRSRLKALLDEYSLVGSKVRILQRKIDLFQVVESSPSFSETASPSPSPSHPRRMSVENETEIDADASPETRLEVEGESSAQEFSLESDVPSQAGVAAAAAAVAAAGDSSTARDDHGAEEQVMAIQRRRVRRRKRRSKRLDLPAGAEVPRQRGRWKGLSSQLVVGDDIRSGESRVSQALSSAREYHGSDDGEESEFDSEDLSTSDEDRSDFEEEEGEEQDGDVKTRLDGQLRRRIHQKRALKREIEHSLKGNEPANGKTVSFNAYPDASSLVLSPSNPDLFHSSLRSRAQTKAFWMPDKPVDSCFKCLAPFTMFTRRHHCRICGQIFCWRCSNYNIGKVRVCQFCVELHSEEDKRKRRKRRRKHARRERRRQRVSSNILISSVAARHELSYLIDDVPIAPRQQLEMDEESPLGEDASSRPGSGAGDHVPDAETVHSTDRPPNGKLARVPSPVVPPVNDGQKSPELFDPGLISQTPSPVLRKKNLKIEGNDVSLADFKSDHRQHLKSLDDYSRCHLIRIIDQLLRSIPISQTRREEWKDIIHLHALKTALTLRLDPRDRMDVRHFVKVKKLPGGSMFDTEYFDGVVMTKNVVFRSMRTNIAEPRLLMLSSPIEFRSGSSFVDLERMVKLEEHYLRSLVKRLMGYTPDVLLCQKACDSSALELLHQAGVSVLVNVKRSLLNRIGRCNQIAPLPSVDKLDVPNAVGECLRTFYREYEIEETCDVAPAPAADAEAGSPAVRTRKKGLFFLLSKLPSRGCSILLRGGTREELKQIEDVLLFAIYAAHHLRLECEFFFDQGGTYIDVPLPTDTPSEDDRVLSISPFVGFPIPGFSNSDILKKMTSPRYHQNIVLLGLTVAKEGVPVDLDSYIDPEIVIVAFYTANDMSLGKYLLIKCFSVSSVRRLEFHKRIFVHHDCRVSFSVERSETNYFGRSIHFWSYCKVCEKFMCPVLRLPRAIFNMSFGKFMETTIYNHSLKSRMSECPHPVHTCHVRYFGYEDLIARVECEKVQVYDIVFPRGRITHNPDIRQAAFVALIKRIRSQFAGFLHELPGRLDDEAKIEIVRMEEERWLSRLDGLENVTDLDTVLSDVSMKLRELGLLQEKKQPGKLIRMMRRLGKKDGAEAEEEGEGEVWQPIVCEFEVKDEDRIGVTLFPREAPEAPEAPSHSSWKRKSRIPTSLIVEYLPDNPVPVFYGDMTSIIAHALSSPEHQQRFRIGPKQIRSLLLSENNDHFKLAHHSGVTDCSYEITCYFPLQFAALRRFFFSGKGNDKFISSMRHCLPWTPTGGKSRSTFTKTWDDRFILKTISNIELQGFGEASFSYFRYISDALFGSLPTCLARLFGAFRLSFQVAGKAHKCAVLVMENLFYDKQVSHAYDLKGSMRNRFQKDEESTMLDENLLTQVLRGNVFVTSEVCKERLTTSVHNDSLFLRKFNIMDYSLLAGADDVNRQYVVGIIDFLRKYTIDKQVETWLKNYTSSREPTVINPKWYKERFRTAIARYFVMSPSKFSGLLE